MLLTGQPGSHERPGGAGIQEITGLAASGNGALMGVGFAASASGEQPTVWNVPAR